MVEEEGRSWRRGGAEGGRSSEEVGYRDGCGGEELGEGRVMVDEREDTILLVIVLEERVVEGRTSESEGGRGQTDGGGRGQ